MTPAQIKSWRAQLNLTQREAAEIVMTKLRMWQYYEQGLYPPRPLTIEYMLQYFYDKFGREFVAN